MANNINNSPRFLTDRDLQEFIAVWKEFGETLTLKQARIEAERLLTLYRVLARKLPPEENDSF